MRREVRDLLLVRPAMSVRHLHALWRITGETDEVVPELLKLSASPAQGTAADADNPQALIALAEIAIADPAVADLVSDRLRSAMHRTRQLGHERTLALAPVLWKLSGRAEEIVPALLALVDRLTEPSGWLPPRGWSRSCCSRRSRLRIPTASLRPCTASELSSTPTNAPSPTGTGAPRPDGTGVLLRTTTRCARQSVRCSTPPPGGEPPRQVAVTSARHQGCFPAWRASLPTPGGPRRSVIRQVAVYGRRRAGQLPTRRCLADRSRSVLDQLFAGRSGFSSVQPVFVTAS
ncbi:hypothetical protein FHR33_003267 [Nonomuraea dietziae]|uniref:Uncharacterized protein n=1 Tax=Nonomuraea dietziae TaxID=65515 RepID=A0A7W5UZ69_9ACTN|nr:hypothetical protein [Nonomuraea dietziae]